MARSLAFNPFTGNFDTISEVTVDTVGSSPNANGASISPVSQVLILQPADGSNPGLMTAGTQTIGGNKTFSGSLTISTVDSAAAGTLNLGTTNASVVNIGNTGASINLYGTTFYQDVTNLEVTDKLFTVNKGGAAASGFGAGFEIEEDALITGSIKTSADRNSWEFLAPNTAGVVTMTPGASGFTIDQGSHDPITLTTVGSSPNANGATLVGQQLQLQEGNASFPGLISTGTQEIGGEKTFTNRIFPTGGVDVATGVPARLDLGTLTADEVRIGNPASTTTIFGTLESSDTVNFTGTVNADITGTADGNTTITPSNHAVVISSATNALSTAAPSATSGVPLVSNGTSADPSFGQLDLSSSSAVVNTLGETNGGTGQSTYTTGDILYSDASNSLAKLPIGADGEVLIVSSGIPAWTSANSSFDIPIATDWASFIPSSFQGFGTTTNVNFYYRRVGDAIEVTGRFTTGTTTASQAQISLPTGLTVATSSKMVPADTAIGMVGQGGVTATNLYVLGQAGLTYVYFGAQSGSTAGLTAVNANAQFASSTAYTIFYRIPIDGWSTNTTITPVGSTLSVVPPTVQRFLTGSGTYTTPTLPRSPTHIKIRMAGGGGGGGGAGTDTGTTGGTGGTTTFGTSLLTCTGGTGGSCGNSTATGGTGGTATVNSPAITIISMSGAHGQGAFGQTQAGGQGGANMFGGGGGGGFGGSEDGWAGVANTGAGGGGGGGGSGGAGGSGGGSGAAIEAIITSPSSSYSYAVGAGGAAGTANQRNGGAGGEGVIIVEEYYQ